MNCHQKTISGPPHKCWVCGTFTLFGFLWLIQRLGNSKKSQHFIMAAALEQFCGSVFWVSSGLSFSFWQGLIQ